MKTLGNVSALLESFFTDYLIQQRQASPHTLASYRDTFCLLLRYIQERLKKSPSTLDLDDLDAPLIGSFLGYLEKERHNSARSRNQRLAAIHSFFRHVALKRPEYGALIQRVLAIPSKRYDRALLDFLTRTESVAILASPDDATWGGRRDRALLTLAIQTGMRVSELICLCHRDIAFGIGAHVRCKGKGRKERCTPLTKSCAALLRNWRGELAGTDSSPLFPNARGGNLSRHGVRYILSKHVNAARRTCPTLERKKVSPHVLRHTAAMNLLQAGVDSSVIALWLGHESVETTQIYIRANIELKEKILAKTAPPGARVTRYQAGDRLLAFLKGL